MQVQGRLTALRRKHPFLALSVVLVALWLLLYAPLLLGSHVLPWDAIDEFYPTAYFNAHSLRMGLAPWWNPYIYSGFPQIADPQGMLFSPLLMAWMLLRQAPGAHWFAWAVLLHLLMGGIAMLALLRRSSARDFGALIGALVFMAGGVAASRLEHVPIVLAYAYAPVVLLALRHFLTGPGLLRGLLLGLAAGALATNLVQVAYLFALMIIGYAVIATGWHWRHYDSRTRWRYGFGVVAAVLLATCIALPQLLFSWAFISLSNRTAMSLADSATASLPLRSLVSLLDPNAWHALSGSYTGPASRVEAYFYIGIMPLLMLCGLGAAWRCPIQRRQVLFFGVVAGVAILYMLGLHAPLYGWLYGWMPGIQHFRRPSDAAYLLNFALAIFTGLSASHFRLDSKRHISILLIATAVGLAWASSQLHGVESPWRVRSLVAALFAVLALWRLQCPGSRARTATWLLLLLVADYSCFNLNGSFDRGHDMARWFMHDNTATFLAHQLHDGHGALKPRIETIDAHVSWDNNVVLRDIPSTQGYNPLRYALYNQWYGARDNGNLPRVDTTYNPSPASTLSDLLSVTYLVRGNTTYQTAAWSPPPGYVPAFSGKTTDVWRNTRAYPRLLTPTQALLVSPGKVPPPQVFADTNFHDSLWLTPRDRMDAQTARVAATICTGRTRVISVQTVPTRTIIRTQGDAPGWLVLSDLDFPGWQADVDGATIPIHRANIMFRALCIPAGNHVVTVAFHPWSMVATAMRQSRHRGSQPE